VPSPSPFPDVEALLAAGQPRSAVHRALARLGAATASFASSVGMQISDGNELDQAASVLGRVAKACVNPSLSARAMQGHGLLLVASPHVAVQDITLIGAKLTIKAASAALPILASPEMVRHVKAGAAAHLLAGRDVLALQEVAPRASGPSHKLGWPMDPLLAACLWCMLGVAWSGLGLFGYTLTLAQGLVCCGWLLGMYVAWKARGWQRVKEAIARWKSPARIPARAAFLALGGALVRITRCIETVGVV